MIKIVMYMGIEPIATKKNHRIVIPYISKRDDLKTSLSHVC